MRLKVSAEVDWLDVEKLRRQLKTQLLGRGDKLLYLPTVDSTNIQAMQLAHQRAEEGVVLLTDSQTAGKGRQGRRWVDVFGCNVLSSTLLRPLFSPHFLVMVASLAVVDAISETCGISATIKWPNDVLIGDAKVAGILIETSHVVGGQGEQNSRDALVAILGIGVNVNGRLQHISEQLETSSSLLANATTLETECGHKVSRETFIAHLLQHIETDYLALQQEAMDPLTSTYGSISRSIRERWRSQLSTLGRSIGVRQGDTTISGIAEDVDDNGELLLRSHFGTLVNITWGDVGYPTR